MKYPMCINNNIGLTKSQPCSVEWKNKVKYDYTGRRLFFFFWSGSDNIIPR